ncbi:MAG TPA: EamA family transporter [Candidatus Acidoferrum sp.]|nr:EamA family transporter [Candidatus Acidoferrum sp.]
MSTTSTSSFVPSPETTQRHVPASPASTGSRTLLLASFAAVYVIWGSTYLAIRIGVETVPPLMLAGLRHFTVGVLLYPLLRWKTCVRPTATHWKTAVVTGCLLLFIGNGGVSWSEQVVPSGITALLVTMVSLWLVIVDWLRPGGHRPVPKVFLGLVLGFAGVALLVGPAHLGGSERVDLGGVAVLVIACFSWACGSIYAKHGGMPNSALLGVAMQSLAGGVVLLFAGLVSGEFHRFHFAAVSWRSWAALAYLVVFGSGIGLSAYLYILQKSTAARVATYALVNPVVALFLGWLAADEIISLRTVVAAVIILTAVVLVITAPHRPHERAQGPGPSPGEV